MKTDEEMGKNPQIWVHVRFEFCKLRVLVLVLFVIAVKYYVLSHLCGVRQDAVSISYLLLQY